MHIFQKRREYEVNCRGICSAHNCCTLTFALGVHNCSLECRGLTCTLGTRCCALSCITWHPSMLQSRLRPRMLHSTHTHTPAAVLFDDAVSPTPTCSCNSNLSCNSNSSCCGREGRPVKRIGQGVIAVVSALICTMHVLC